MVKRVGESQRLGAEFDEGGKEGLDEDLANGLGENGSSQGLDVDAD